MINSNQDFRKRKALSAEHPGTLLRQNVLPDGDEVEFADGTRIPITDKSIYAPIELGKIRREEKLKNNA